MGKFAIGDRVSEVIKSRKDGWNRKVGKVFSSTNDSGTNVYIIELDLHAYYKSKGEPPTYKRYEEADLMLEADAKSALNDLEDAFNKLQDELKVKIVEAANLIKEAGDIAEEHGEELAEMHDATDPLLSAMDNAGWRTSSLSC
jgi:hypothetical protein